MPTTKGKFIVIEGLEGAGKTTAKTRAVQKHYPALIKITDFNYREF